ncbi:MAG: MCE family protein [Mycobacterium sp.]
MSTRTARTELALLLVALLVGGGIVVVRFTAGSAKTHIVAYFDNTNGLFTGDEVRILGVPVGRIDAIEPQADRVKVSVSVDAEYMVPATAMAVVLSPQLITARAIQLTPAYTTGPVMTDGAIIPLNRTAVPVEWDDLRQQLQKLTEALQPTESGGVSSIGAFIDTAADNLRGEGANIRDTVIKMSQAFSVLGDHSNDIFSTIKNLSLVVSALEDSGTLMGQLNGNLAAVTALLVDDPDAVGQAVRDLNSVVDQSKVFIAENREALGTTTDKLSSMTTAVVESIDDIKQTLHAAPTAFQNLANAYNPAQGAVTAALAVNNFANPISFLCGAIEAASRLGADQAAKLCVQYLAPIVKNRQYNFPPIGENLLVGTSARPNEVTYSEDWMRPDYVPPPPQQLPASSVPPAATPPAEPAPGGPPLPAEEPVATDPAAGLPGMMVPSGAVR